MLNDIKKILDINKIYGCSNCRKEYLKALKLEKKGFKIQFILKQDFSGHYFHLNDVRIAI